MRVKSSHDELLEILNRETARFDKAMRDLALASLSDDFSRMESARQRMVRLASESMALVDLMGRRRLLLEADQFRKRNEDNRDGLVSVRLAATDVVKAVTFREAVRDIVSREPRLADTWERVAELYSGNDHVFSLVRSADEHVTASIQKRIGKFVAKGVDYAKAAQKLRREFGDEMEDFTQAYAETVYRTNMSTAYTAGRFQQAFDPDVAEVIGAFMYASAELPQSRPNHVALHGLIAATTDPIWEQIAPPNGYNCLCDLILVDRWELEKRGLLENGTIQLATMPAGGGRDPGFGGGNASWRIYAGG